MCQNTDAELVPLVLGALGTDTEFVALAFGRGELCSQRFGHAVAGFGGVAHAPV